MWSEMEFLNSDWMPYVILADIILLVVFAWKEWKTNSGKKLFSMLGLVIIALSALAMLALKPAVPHLISKNTAIVLTEAYDESKLDSLTSVYREAEILDYHETGNLSAAYNSNRTLILGNGIKPYDLHKIEAKNNPIYIPGEVPDGIIQLKYNKKISLGDTINIEGNFNNPASGQRLVLEDFAGNSLDSVQLLESKTQNFKLNTNAILEGNYLYSLMLKNSLGEILKTEVVPVVIENRSPLKVLILNSYPLFETKYLKEFLKRQDNEVSIKTRISRGRYKFEFLNTGNRALGKLSEDLLKDYDLLILNSDYLTFLSANEVTSIKQALNSGMGLFIQPDEGFFNANQELTGFRFYNDRSSLHLNFDASENLEKYNYFFAKQETLIPIIENDNKIYSAYKMVGSGKIGSFVFSNLYQLVLNGETQTYELIWSKVINTLAGKESIPADWEIKNFPVYKNEPLVFNLRTKVSEPTILTSDSNLVPLAMHPEIPNLWKGKVYSSKTGWNTLEFTKDSLSLFNYYVHENNSWEALESYNTRLANIKNFSNDIKEDALPEELRPVNRFWFFTIFLFAVFFLWLIPKLN